MTKPTNDIYRTQKGQAMIDREKRWPLMRLDDGRIMRIARRNLIKIELKKEFKI